MKLIDIARRVDPNFDSLSVLDKVAVLDKIGLALAYNLLEADDVSNTVIEKGVLHD